MIAIARRALLKKLTQIHDRKKRQRGDVGSKAHYDVSRARTYPFSAPAVSPLTTYRWSSSANAAEGRSPTRLMAAISV